MKKINEITRRYKMKNVKEWAYAGVGFVVGFLLAVICAANGVLTY
jgi:uncharacterized protein YacL